jgi:hypothetical protein
MCRGYKVQYVRIWIRISGYPNIPANLDRIKGYYPILSYPFTSLGCGFNVSGTAIFAGYTSTNTSRFPD